MPDPQDSNTAPDMPEVSTEAARQALDAMSEQLVQKLHRMIEEQDARVREFSVQNTSLSPLPTAPQPAPQQERPQRVQQQQRVPAPPTRPIQPAQPAPEPQQPSFTEQDITPEEAIEKFERLWEENKRRKREQQGSELPPVPTLRNPIKRKAPRTENKKEGNCGTWVFFIVVIIILIRACTEA